MQKKFITKICEYCGKPFIVGDNCHERAKRFCNTSCSARWRNETIGAHKQSEEHKQKLSQLLKKRWQDPQFRENNKKRMTEHNPVFIPGVVEKANETRLRNDSYRNNYKYGNGKISAYERKVFDYLIEKDFIYNYAIATKIARHAFPDKHYAVNYKPDFVNLKYKICIEIDGDTHTTEQAKRLDRKKDECLNFLGFKVYRFTHEEIDTGYLFTEVDRIWQSL